MVALSQIQTAQLVHQQAIRRLFAAERLESVPFINGSYAGYYGRADDAEFDPWLAGELDPLLAVLQREAVDAQTFHPLVVEFAPLGVHYVDALFGAQVFTHEGQYWSHSLPGSIAGLAPVDIGNSSLVHWTLHALNRLLARLPDAVATTTPIFSSPLNVAINLFGEQVLMDLASPDERILHGFAVICDAIAGLHQLAQERYPADRLRFYCSSTRWAPNGVGHICGCSTQLLAPETYATCIAPLDERILRTHPAGGTIHLCGRHTQHLPCWRAMPALRAVQLNDAAANDFPAYFTALRDDQLIYITPTELMPRSRILEISAGRRVIDPGTMDSEQLTVEIRQSVLCGSGLPTFTVNASKLKQNPQVHEKSFPSSSNSSTHGSAVGTGTVRESSAL